MKNVRHIGIVVSNLQKSLEFYEKLLGLKIKVQAFEEGNYIDAMLGQTNVRVTTVKMLADDGQTLIELLKFWHPEVKKEPAPPMFKIGPTHVAFTVDNLELTCHRLAAARVPFVSSIVTAPSGKAKAVFCRDPDGTLIELVEEL